MLFDSMGVKDAIKLSGLSALKNGGLSLRVSVGGGEPMDYAKEIRRMFTSLQNDYGYSELDAMLVLKDILAHEYLDNRKK